MDIMLLFWGVVGVLIGALIGQTKGRTGAGAVLGLLLGPIGWLAVALGPNYKPKCHLCGGVIVSGARRCKNCGAELGQRTSTSNQKQYQAKPAHSAEDTVPCPHCNLPLPISTLDVGSNTCPFCNNEFDVK